MSVIDIEKLVQPIAGEKAVGEDLRADISATSVYYQVKDARNSARQIERKIQNGNNEDGDLPEWGKVFTLCNEILLNKSKDLEIAVWLIEALIRKDGFAGLSAGLQLLSALIDTYWDDIYPLPDEDGLETRIIPLVWLNGDDADGILMQPIRNIAITQGSSMGPFALWQYQQALANEALTDATQKAKKVELGETFVEDIQKAVSESTPQFYEQLLQDLELCQKSFQEWCAVIEAKVAEVMIPTSQIKSELDNFADHLRFIIKDAPFVVRQGEGDVEDAEMEAPDADSSSNVATKSDGKVMSRISALRDLEKIASFFKNTEPHSPIPYMLERAVRWGSMPFPELLKELINDDSARKNAFEMAGLDAGVKDN